MKNKQWDILSEIKTNLETLTEFNYVDYYPDSVQFIGNKYPALLIESGDETFELGTGGLINSDLYVSIYLYHNINQNRIKYILILQNKIIAKLQDSLTNNDTALLIEIESVEKGAYSSVVDKYNIGWYPNLSVIKLNFKIKVCYTR